VSILSRRSLEVKEISVKMRRFGTRLPQKPVGRFGTTPGQLPYIQHRHFGPVIALALCNMFGTGNKAEWDTNTT